MVPSWGVPLEEIELGIKHGVRKVNFDTDLRMALTGTIRKVPAEDNGQFDPRKYLAPGVEAMSAVCFDRFDRSGCAGMASISGSFRSRTWPNDTNPDA
ncbi:class II fructose-bisphosphate aldolase [Meridianimarinicoccus aquatilis]|uniref:class II fructose-bisphosphate aldolase n=1 Tax=Meridianimarinicoccus aquatilis TaxID=2552766 RepID=UPI001FB58DAE|nr:class II fructose-bisphosphate aldolase [Fluviibacterium aquatile]